MLHPLNMDKTYFYIITSDGGKRRVSNKMYVILPCITGLFKRYSGRLVRLISLSENLMPGDHIYANGMAVVTLSHLARDGFNVMGDSDTPGTMGIDLKDLAPA